MTDVTKAFEQLNEQVETEIKDESAGAGSIEVDNELAAESGQDAASSEAQTISGLSAEELAKKEIENSDKGLGSGDESQNSKPKSIKELTEGKFETEEELIAAYKESEAKNISITEDFDKYKGTSIVPTSLARRVYELEQKGITVTPKLLEDMDIKWSEMDTTNIDEASKMISTEMKLSNPELTDKEIEFQMREAYGYDEDKRREDLSEKYPGDEEKVDSIIKEEKDNLATRMSIKAKTSKKALLEYQENLTKVEAKEGPTDEENKIAYLDNVSKAMAEIDTVSVKVGDGEVKIDVSKEQKEGISKTIESLVTDPTTFWENLGGIPGLAEKLAIAMNLDSVVKEVGKRSESEARAREAAGLTNQSPNEIGNAGVSEDIDDDVAFAKAQGVL